LEAVEAVVMYELSLVTTQVVEVLAVSYKEPTYL
jgi:hypothetical protein